jgi:hypothetical protein
MKHSTLKALASIACLLMLSFTMQAQMVSIQNGTDCDVIIELGFQNSADPPCTSHTPVWVNVPCNSGTNVPFPAGADVFKGYQIDPSGDASTFGVNVVYHCATWDPTNCSSLTPINPGCGNCTSATGTCWYNLGGGVLTADYAIRIF